MCILKHAVFAAPAVSHKKSQIQVVFWKEWDFSVLWHSPCTFAADWIGTFQFSDMHQRSVFQLKQTLSCFFLFQASANRKGTDFIRSHQQRNIYGTERFTLHLTMKYKWIRNFSAWGQQICRWQKRLKHTVFKSLSVKF